MRRGYGYEPSRSGRVGASSDGEGELAQSQAASFILTPLPAQVGSERVATDRAYPLERTKANAGVMMRRGQRYRLALSP